MNGFPRIELEGLGNNKAVCQQVICSAAGMQRELEKLFHRLSFPDNAGGNMVNKKEKKIGKGIRIQIQTQLAKVRTAFFGFLFFYCWWWFYS